MADDKLPTHKDLPCSDSELLENARQFAEGERQRAEKEKKRADRLAAKLRQLGVDPDQV